MQLNTKCKTLLPFKLHHETPSREVAKPLSFVVIVVVLLVRRDHSVPGANVASGVVLLCSNKESAQYQLQQ